MSYLPSAVESHSPQSLSMENLYSQIENMHGVINLDAMNSLLQVMLTRMHKQEAIINKLSEQVNETIVPSYHLIREHLSRLDQRLTVVDEKVGKALHASTANLLDTQYSSADLATSNFYQLQKISKAITTFITRAEVERQYNELLEIKNENRTIQQDLSQVHNIINEMNLVQSHFSETVAQQESRLSLKLDRSELPHLQTLANKVLTYEDFKNDSLKRIIFMEQKIPTIETNVDENSKEIASIQGNLTNHIIYNMNKMALKRDVHVLAKELKNHQQILETVAFKSNIDELRMVLNETVHLISVNEKETNINKKDILALNKSLKLKANQDEVAQCLKKSEFEEAIVATNLEIQSKTDIPFTEALQSHIQTIEEKVHEVGQQASVAVKFVEWFTSRGENYEHNIKIIDRHLRDLVPNEKSLKYSHLTFFEPPATIDPHK